MKKHTKNNLYTKRYVPFEPLRYCRLDADADAVFCSAFMDEYR